MDEMQKLERELAYSSARSDIECYCDYKEHSGQHYGRWYDLNTAKEYCSDFVAMAVRYLDLRKLLKRHPERSELVRVLDDV